MLLNARSGPHDELAPRMGGLATLHSYGTVRELNLIPDDHIKFLKSCLDHFETDTHIFVHANYFPDIPMDEQPRRDDEVGVD